MRSKSLIDKRNKEIYDAYAKLWGQGLREEIIWPQLVEQFYLEPKTIYRICLEFTKEEKGITTVKKQLDLFVIENENPKI